MAGKLPLQTHLLLRLALAENFKRVLVRLMPSNFQEKSGLLSHLKTIRTEDALSCKGYQCPDVATGRWLLQLTKFSNCFILCIPAYTCKHRNPGIALSQDLKHRITHALPNLHLYHKSLHFGVFLFVCFSLFGWSVLDSCNIPIKTQNFSKRVWGFAWFRVFTIGNPRKCDFLIR